MARPIVRSAGQEIVALCSGIGMVNAAAGAEHVISAWNPRMVLNFGCAGAHRRDLLPGDVVIGAGTVHHGAVHILSSGEEYFPDRPYTVTGETVASTELDADPAPARAGAGGGARLDARAVAAALGWPEAPRRGRPRWKPASSPRPTSGPSFTNGSTPFTRATAPSAKTWKRPPSPRFAAGTASRF